MWTGGVTIGLDQQVDQRWAVGRGGQAGVVPVPRRRSHDVVINHLPNVNHVLPRVLS